MEAERPKKSLASASLAVNFAVCVASTQPETGFLNIYAEPELFPASSSFQEPITT